MDEGTLQSIRQVLREPHGRTAMWWILQQAGIYRVAGADLSTFQAGFEAGARNVGIRILSGMNEADPRAYGEMLLAAAADEEVRRAEAEKEREQVDDE